MIKIFNKLRSLKEIDNFWHCTQLKVFSLHKTSIHVCNVSLYLNRTLSCKYRNYFWLTIWLHLIAAIQVLRSVQTNVWIGLCLHLHKPETDISSTKGKVLVTSEADFCDLQGRPPKCHIFTPTLRGTNIKLDKQGVGQTLSLTNIEWDKHRIGQTLDGTNIKWDKNWFGQTLIVINIGWDKHWVEQAFSWSNFEWIKQ